MTNLNNYEERLIGNELLLIPDINSTLRETLVLNNSATSIYFLIKEKNSYDDILKSLLDRYDVDISIIKKDLDETIKVLKEKRVMSD